VGPYPLSPHPRRPLIPLFTNFVKRLSARKSSSFWGLGRVCSRSLMANLDITRRSRSRALHAAARRYDGLSFREIGREMGVTVETARQAVLKGERILKRDYSALNHCAEKLARK